MIDEQRALSLSSILTAWMSGKFSIIKQQKIKMSRVRELVQKKIDDVVLLFATMYREK